MRWLAFTGDDRDSATEYSASLGGDFAGGVAEMYAETQWESADAFNQIDVTVIEIADDGTETTRMFRVVVDYSPSFYAHSVPNAT